MTPYPIDLHTNDHAFLKGHRIMVQIQSTWFPLYDANPQTFVDNIFNGAGLRLSEGHTKGLPLGARSFARRAAGRAVKL